MYTYLRRRHFPFENLFLSFLLIDILCILELGGSKSIMIFLSK